MTEITIERVDHIGIRLRDLDHAMAFYEALGFKLVNRVTFDPVAIVRDDAGVEIIHTLEGDMTVMPCD